MLYNLNNYRDILKKKIMGRSRGEITRIAEILDTNLATVSQILSGKRHITVEQAVLVSNYFEFDNNEKDYFIALVHKARTKNEDLKKYWSSKIESYRAHSESVSYKVKAQKELDDLVKSKFYSSHLYSAISLFCSIGNGKTVENICDKFKLTRSSALHMLEFLAENNLVTYKNNKYWMSTQNTHVPKESDYVYRHHANWRIQRLSHLEIKEPEISFTGPYSLDKKAFEEIKKEILELIGKATAKAHAAPAEDIACLNIDLFWVDS